MSASASLLDFDPIISALSDRFAAVADRAAIIRLVDVTAAEFADARILDYVPVLVQHKCTDQLRSML